MIYVGKSEGTQRTTLSKGNSGYDYGISGKFCKSISHPRSLPNFPSKVVPLHDYEEAHSGGTVVTVAESEKRTSWVHKKRWYMYNSSGMTSLGQRTSQGQYLSSRLFSYNSKSLLALLYALILIHRCHRLHIRRLTACGHLSKPSAGIIDCNPTWCAMLWSLFCRWGNWGTRDAAACPSEYVTGPGSQPRLLVPWSVLLTCAHYTINIIHYLKRVWCWVFKLDSVSRLGNYDQIRS